MANYQEISFPRGWFNTYPQTQPNPAQHIPENTRKIRKRVQQTDLLGNPLWKSDGTPKWTTCFVDPPSRPTHPEPPPADPLQLVIMGLLGLGLDRGKSRKIPKVGKQKQTEQANNQTNKNTDRCPTRTTPKEKCIICKGPHTNLMFCPKLTQYLPFGRYQTPPGCLCVKCLSTKHWNAKKV